MTVEYLSLNGFAHRVGLSRGTLVQYRKQGRIPEPDAVIGGNGSAVIYGWLPQTVEYWASHRVGQGKRTDLTQD